MSVGSVSGYLRKLRSWMHGGDAHERTLALMGAMLSRQVASVLDVASLHQVEFRVYSQWGDDGIIQWLVARLPSLPKTFVEFGVEDYSESNTRFLMVNNNWRGLVMDGSASNIAYLRKRNWFWRHDLTAIPCFLTRDNVDATIAGWAAGADVGLLHIDVDGNDYWLWDALHSVKPGIVIMEYNAVFGKDRAITIPYAKDFQRHQVHYSGLYSGGSLAALTYLAERKGYALVGSNSAGNNAYYVRRDLLGGALRGVSIEDAYVEPGFRESRDRQGHLDYLPFADRAALIRGLPVVNVVTGQTEPF